MAEIKAKKVLFKNRDGESLIPYIGEDYVKQEDMVEINLGNSFQLFDTKMSDKILSYEESKGWALQGTYVYKESLAGSRYGYPDFYAKVIEEYNKATTTETVNGVTVKVHSNGHKFYNIADKTGIDEFFNTMGSAWLYGIDTANERIFLPRDKYFAVTGDVAVAGNGMALGLTNGTLNVGLVGSKVQTNNRLFDTRVYGVDVSGDTLTDPQQNNGFYGVTTDSTKSGIEGKLTANEDRYLYICVGNTTNYEGVTDVVNQGMEILEQINAGFVQKDSMREVPCIVETYVNGGSGYRLWSDGFGMQWGNTGSNANTITYLRNFRDTNYNIQFSPEGSVNYQTVKSRTVDGFVLNGSQSIQNWMCFGYFEV